MGVCDGKGEEEVKLRKGVEAKRRQEELIEGLQTLLTGTLGDHLCVSCRTCLDLGNMSQSDIDQGLLGLFGSFWVVLGLSPRLCLSTHSTTDKLLNTTE